VDYVHSCAFCGWNRVAATAVVLPAGCPECGCAVDSHDTADAARRTRDAAPARLPKSPAARVTMWLFALALVLTAAHAGNSFSGLSGAVTAVGVAGFLLLPLVPERLPASR
jgi:hypothetical protein